MTKDLMNKKKPTTSPTGQFAFSPILSDPFKIGRSSYPCPAYTGPFYRDGGEVWQEMIICQLAEDDTVQKLYQSWIQCDKDLMRACKIQLLQLLKSDEDKIKHMNFRLALGILQAFDHWTLIQEKYGACGGVCDHIGFHVQVKSDLKRTIELVQFMIQELAESEEEESSSEEAKAVVVGPEQKDDHYKVGSSGDYEDNIPNGLKLKEKNMMSSPIIKAFLQCKAASSIGLNLVMEEGERETRDFVGMESDDNDDDGDEGDVSSGRGSEDAGSICSDLGLEDLELEQSTLVVVEQGTVTSEEHLLSAKKCQGKEYNYSKDDQKIVDDEEDGFEFLPIITTSEDCIYEGSGEEDELF